MARGVEGNTCGLTAGKPDLGERTGVVKQRKESATENRCGEGIGGIILSWTATEGRAAEHDLSALYVFGGAGAFALIARCGPLVVTKACLCGSELRAPDRTTVRHLS